MCKLFFISPLILQETKRQESYLFDKVGRPRADFKTNWYDKQSLESKSMLLTSFVPSVPFVILGADSQARIVVGKVILNNSPVLMPQFDIKADKIVTADWSFNFEGKLCFEQIACYNLNKTNGIISDNDGKPLFRIEQVDDVEIYWPYMGGSVIGLNITELYTKKLDQVDATQFNGLFDTKPKPHYNWISARLY